MLCVFSSIGSLHPLSVLLRGPLGAPAAQFPSPRCALSPAPSPPQPTWDIGRRSIPPAPQPICVLVYKVAAVFPAPPCALSDIPDFPAAKSRCLRLPRDMSFVAPSASAFGPPHPCHLPLCGSLKHPPDHRPPPEAAGSPCRPPALCGRASFLCETKSSIPCGVPDTRLAPHSVSSGSIGALHSGSHFAQQLRPPPPAPPQQKSLYIRLHMAACPRFGTAPTEFGVLSVKLTSVSSFSGFPRPNLFEIFGQYHIAIMRTGITQIGTRFPGRRPQGFPATDSPLSVPMAPLPRSVSPVRQATP